MNIFFSLLPLNLFISRFKHLIASFYFTLLMQLCQKHLYIEIHFTSVSNIFFFNTNRTLSFLKLCKVGHIMFGFLIQNVCYKSEACGTVRNEDDGFR